MKKPILTLSGAYCVGLIIWAFNTDYDGEVEVATEKTSIPATKEGTVPHDKNNKLGHGDSTKKAGVPENSVVSNNEKKGELLPWRRPSKEFTIFQDLSNKPLINSEEQDEFIALINDYEMIEHARKALFKTINEPDLDLTEEKRRLDAVQYLSTIISGKYNSSQMIHAVQLIYDRLDTDTIQGDFSLDLKKSLVGDKIELGLHLSVFQPKLWQEYKDNHQGDEKKQKLIEYIDQSAQNQRDILKANAQKIASRLRERAKVQT